MKSKRFSYTGGLQTFIVPETGLYHIQAVGAAGSVGNQFYFEHLRARPGKGAMISAKVLLEAGDELVILVGGKGESKSANILDAASGGGGGGTFVFRKIPQVTNTLYQFTKGSDAYEALVVAAGGSGTQDIGKINKECLAPDGQGENFCHPALGIKYSTDAYYPTYSTDTSASVLGVRQFILYDGKGPYYTRSGGTAQGGYGGGGSADNECAPGGGWSKITGYPAKVSSWSIVADAIGVNGYGEYMANGYCFIGPAAEGEGRPKGIHVQVNDTWKRAKKAFISVDGVWRRAKAALLSAQGKWQQVMKKMPFFILWGIGPSLLTMDMLQGLLSRSMRVLAQQHQQTRINS